MHAGRLLRYGLFICISIVLGTITCPVPMARAIHPDQVSITYQLQFQGNNAWSHLQAIMAYNPRYPGTAGINLTATYIETTLSANGGTVIEHPFSVNGIHCKNIIGKWVPASNSSGEIVILASHYDARARANEDPDLGKKNDPVPAANDGGSSTVILLEMARILNLMYNNATLAIDRETWLVFFDAEDQGSGGMSSFDWIEGSTALAASLGSFGGNSTNVKLFMLLDMVGGTGLQVDQEYNSNQGLLSSCFAMGQCLGYNGYFPSSPRGRYITDDHIPFRNLGIPCLDIIDLDYPEWHTTADDLAHVSMAVIGGMGKVSEAFLLTKLVNASTLAIADAGTGHVWTADGCTGDTGWLAVAAFLGQYWPYMTLAGVAIIVAIWAGLRRKNQCAAGI
nr:M28 family peptidase [Candidatus Sigynarchaeota archaeon]